MTARMFSPILPNLILLKARHLNLFNKSLTITDPDHDKYKLRYATCIITPVTGNLDTDNEVLAAGPCSLAISSINFDSQVGTLKLTGNATEDEYAACLQSVTYQHRGEVAFTIVRDMHCSVSDGVHQDAVSVTVTNINVNDAPVVSFPNGQLTSFRNYKQYGPDERIFQDAVLQDSDNVYVEGARIVGRNLHLGDGDVLMLLGDGTINIDPVCHADFCVITLSGTATLVSYSMLIKSAVFKNSGLKPYLLLDGLRFFNLSIFDGELWSNEVNVTVDTIPVNDPPIVQFDPSADPEALPENEAAKQSAVKFFEDGQPVSVFPNTTTLRDVDSSEGNRIECVAIDLADGVDEKITVNETLAEWHSLTVTSSWHGENFKLSVVGLASFEDIRAILLTVEYFNEKEEPTSGTRSVYCSVSDSGNATSDNVTTAVNVFEINDPIDVRFEEDVLKVSFTEGSEAGVHVLPEPHRIESSDSEDHGVSRIEFILRSEPPGHLDSVEFLFVLKSIPEGLSYKPDGELKKLTFTATPNLSRNVLLKLARIVYYINQADEPTLFVGETLVPVYRYIEFLLYDSGHVPALTKVVIEVCIATDNEHAPTVQFSIDTGLNDNCLQPLEDLSRRNRRAATSKESQSQVRRLKVVGMTVSDPMIKPGTSVELRFSGKTNRPKLEELSKRLTLAPKKIQEVPHIGLWQTDDTLTILFVGYGKRGWELPSNWLSVSFEARQGLCSPKTACVNGVCNEERNSCPVVGSYSLSEFLGLHQHEKITDGRSEKRDATLLTLSQQELV
eukprot:m.279611 g.279611  ORF g.279611 m.279611 type:complete len:785 (+) comp40624_c1_seq19:3392-5746(+)